MSLIRSRNTKPEIVLRKYLTAAGLKYRLHKADLPGKPDIILNKHNTVIFVHGCFWHQHKNCKRANIPKSNEEYWTKKLENNVNRDKLSKQMLKNTGWKVIVIWECQMKYISELGPQILETILKK